MPERGRPAPTDRVGNGPTLVEIDMLYRTQSRRVLATLIRLLGDFELAEEALHDAFIAAVQQWPRDGLPSNPRAWLVSAGRFKAIDGLRRRARFDASLSLLADQLDSHEEPEWEHEDLEDDRLRLIFTCCHPALPADAQVALTLREVCDLKTEEIARAFFVSPSTIAQRIVRAKQKIRDARIPYRVPTREELPARLDNVLRVIYLVFNEGYSASSGSELTRADLELVRLDEQDRSRWNQAQIAEGAALVQRALASRRFGPYTVQAAIVAVHAEAASSAETDWVQIVGLYDLLLRISPSPVIELNRAVALAMRDGAAVGLAAIDRLLARGELRDYHLLHAARADFCRQLGRLDEAREAYRTALALAQLDPEKRFLQQRLNELDTGPREA